MLTGKACLNVASVAPDIVIDGCVSAFPLTKLCHSVFGVLVSAPALVVVVAVVGFVLEASAELVA